MNALHTATVSCWMNDQADHRQPLQGDIEMDVCVVGAGIAGLSTAYLLARAGVRVAVLDGGAIGGGETERTTAHLSDAIDARFVEIERIHGAETARLVAESHSAAIDCIETIARNEAIVCGFERVDGHLVLGEGQEPELLVRELEACHRAGLTQVELRHGVTLGNWRSSVGLLFPRQGQFHPMRYLTGLAAAVERHGGRIHTNTMVAEVEGGSSAHVRTAQGAVVRCQHVVVATNTPFNDRVALHTKQAAYRTYALAAAVPVNSLPRGLWWDTEDPYHYVRLGGPARTPGQELLIVGGEDCKTGQDSQPNARLARLEAWARQRFPQLGAVEYSWSGQVLETVDGLAYIGRNPLDQANVYVATGDCGMGLTHGTIAGILLTDLIQGREHPWTAVYDPSRKRIRAAGEYARENLNVARQFTDWVSGSEVASVEDVPPGGAALVRRGLRMLAVYREGNGQLHERSAVCPHLGCVVHWNGLEKSWDCPCHGSRFDCTGENVINGPATSGLEDAKVEAEGVASR